VAETEKPRIAPGLLSPNRKGGLNPREALFTEPPGTTPDGYSLYMVQGSCLPLLAALKDHVVGLGVAGDVDDGVPVVRGL
jgi:hypothetical protein